MKKYPLDPTGFNRLNDALLSNPQVSQEDQFQSYQAGLPTAASGNILYRGITLKYNWDGATLTLDILKRPWVVSASMIWEQVDKWLVVQA